MRASCPSLRCSCRKNLSYTEKQRYWSRSCGLQDLLKYNDCALSCAMTYELLATVGWKWGCHPFSCRCSLNVTHCRKEICSTYLFKASIPATHFGNFNHQLPTRSRFLRAAVRSTCSALWLHHAHPFVADTKKSSPCREAEGLVTELWSPRSVKIQWLCSQLCYDIWAFSNSGLEVGLPAFQLPMFAKCDTLPKGDLFDILF